MDYHQDKIRVITDELDRLRQVAVREIDDFRYCPVGYHTVKCPPKEALSAWQRDSVFGGKDMHFWFHTRLRTPEPRDGMELYIKVSTGYEGEWDCVNPQGIVYLNGVLTQGVDVNHQFVLLQAGTEYDLDVCMYTSLHHSIEARFRVELLWVDTAVEALYYDLKVPLDTSCCVSPEREEYWLLLRVLGSAVQMLDLRSPGSEAFYTSIALAREYLSRELYGTLCGSRAPVVHCVGHTHIDVAWLWTLAQTQEKVQRSFSTVLRLMEQYPEYVFMSSQPQLYQYLKARAPDLYQQILERVRQGRWEVEGAMWLEADCSLTSGESLVRQILYGKRFMREEFGVDSHILWLPDVFGYSAALPQILRKSGVDRFFTTKISWNETNKLPYDAFMWEGIDGTEVFTAFGTARDIAAPGENDIFTTYSGNTDPKMLQGTWERFQQKEYSNRTLIPFGHGDGGGGPTRQHLEVLRRTSRGLPGIPRAKISTVGEYMDRLYEDMQSRAKVTGRMPRWVGELYLELHRGTYTSIAKNKRSNRKSELLLQKAETLASIARILQNAPYPDTVLHTQWLTVLLNQFHDIIPGSAIREVYEESDRQYAVLFRTGEEIAACALRTLAEHICAEGLVVYNPLGFARGGMVQHEGQYYWADAVPAMGWTVIPQLPVVSQVKGTAHSLENELYLLELDDTGAICSLIDKRVDRQLCLPGKRLNELQVFENFPRYWDAWEISEYYREKMWTVDELISAETVEEAVRRGIRLTWNYDTSTITQTIYLYDHSPRIDFETEVNWQQKHQLLKAAFPLDLHVTEATYEIQFGHLVRPTHQNTSWDAAKFEVWAHKWADVSEHGYGVSLLNDCKYGYSAQGSVLKLTLLKDAVYPNPDADRGKHVFTYSLLPHVGDFREAGTIHEAYGLNQPLMAAAPAASGDQNTLSTEFSLVECGQSNLIIETFKKAEDGEAFILRLYEAFGQRTQAALTLNVPFQKAELCDLNETPVDCDKLFVFGQKITFPVRSFEIITLRITI